MTAVPAQRLPAAQPPPPRVKRWTKQEYTRLTELGAFRGQRIYLFRGELIEMPPQFHLHAYAVMKLNAALHATFGVNAGFEIRIQLPFETPGDSMPEPDALVCTTRQGTRHPHPDQAELVIEVADSSVDKDRDKALDYAASGIPEYWILDVNARLVEVYRQPIADGTAALGSRYASVQLLDSRQAIDPLAKPGVLIQLTQFFP
jgi:Uma2 family endonuclease